MSELVTLARPYAEAVFDKARESKTSAEWSDMLEFLSAVVQDQTIIAAAENPKFSEQNLTQLMLDICQDKLSKEGTNFLKLLVVNDRLSLVPYIAELFEQYREDDEGYINIDVQSAFTINQQEQKKLATALKKKLGKKVQMEVAVDQSLIGGIVVRAGDKVIDGSIKGQLQQLAKRL